MPRRIAFGIVLLVVAVLVTGVAQAQTKPAQAPSTTASLAGRYEGTAGTPDGTETFVAELKVEKDVITGVITTPTTVVTITGGTVAGDKFTLSIDMGGAPGTISGILKGGAFEGQWVIGDSGGPFTMKKAAAAAATPASPSPAAAATEKPAAPGAAAPAGGDPLTGDWDAVIDMGGNQMPFTLSVKLDGQKVTGQLGSDQGVLPYEGTWINGTLNFAVATPQGMSITMSATIVEGKLAGTFSIADGQFTGGWAAAKRK